MGENVFNPSMRSVGDVNPVAANKIHQGQDLLLCVCVAAGDVFVVQYHTIKKTFEKTLLLGPSDMTWFVYNTHNVLVNVMIHSGAITHCWAL